MKTANIILKNLSVGYSGRTLMTDVNAVFSAGTLTALIGRNGTGKSTLLRVMAGLISPLAGEVLVADMVDSAQSMNIAVLPPRKLATFIGFVSTERIRVTTLKVHDVVALGRIPYTDWIGRLTSQDKVAVSESLEAVGMSMFACKTMDTLSDGEAQRVMVARVLAQDTPVILLDEPTAFLDFYARREVCELLAGLAHEHHKTIIFSSHELALVREFADSQLEIADNFAKFVFQQ
jgi:iron complex transport system ATP-binding protein